MVGRWALYAAFVTLAATAVRIGDGDETQSLPRAPPVAAARLADRKIARAKELNARAEELNWVPGLRMEDRKNFEAPPPGRPPAFEPPAAQVDDMATDPGLRMDDWQTFQAPPPGLPPGFEPPVAQVDDDEDEEFFDAVDCDEEDLPCRERQRQQRRSEYRAQVGFNDLEEDSELGAQVDMGDKTRNLGARARAKAANARPLVSDMDEDSEDFMDEDSEQGAQVDMGDKTRNLGALARAKAAAARAAAAVRNNWNTDYSDKLAAGSQSYM